MSARNPVRPTIVGSSAPLGQRRATAAQGRRAGLRAGLWLASIVVSTLPIRAQQTPTAQLRGQVVTPNRTPIVGAEVVVLPSSPATTSDSLGRFRLLVEPGVRLVSVRRIGYQSAIFRVALSARQDQEVEIVLERGAYELPTIAVTARNAKPIEYAWTTRYDDFFRRRMVGLGRFLTREDIEKAKAFRTPNLLVGTTGVHLHFYHLGPSGTGVEFTRCHFGGAVDVWVDGFKQRFPVVAGERGGWRTTPAVRSEPNRDDGDLSGARRTARRIQRRELRRDRDLDPVAARPTSNTHLALNARFRPRRRLLENRRTRLRNNVRAGLGSGMASGNLAADESVAAGARSRRCRPTAVLNR